MEEKQDTQEKKTTTKTKVVKKRGRPKKVTTGIVDFTAPKEPKMIAKQATPYLERSSKQPANCTIDWDQFERLCGMQCEWQEIADFFKVERQPFTVWVEKVYNKPYQEVHRIFGAPGLCSLRRSQFALAKHNSQMAIWLGKIYLNQVDPAHSRVEETVDKLSAILDEIDDETKKLVELKDNDFKAVSF